MSYMRLTQARDDFRDALVELERQVGYVIGTLWPRDYTAAALDAVEGELRLKMDNVRDCAAALRLAVEEAQQDRQIGEAVFPRRRT